MKPNKSDRRSFLKGAVAAPVLLSAGLSSAFAHPIFRPVDDSKRKAKIKLSCNFYSFNAPLRSGEMSVEQAIDVCAELGFDAIDPTGYYLTGYPDPPKDSYLYRIKKRAFLQGLDISGTGVRNDFTVADAGKRAADIAHIKQWVEVAAKLDAPVLRIFTGRTLEEGYTSDDYYRWVIDGIQECTAYGEQHGVMIVLQNHNELCKTAEDVLRIRRAIDSDWFGINLDIGSLRQGDPYEEVARLAPYAYTWQIKENVYRNEKEEKTDVKKIVQILLDSGYRGYIPLETLGPGDPKEKMTRFLAEVKKELKIEN
jgi:sugar phosphate isomerase/epimerase